MPHYPLADHWSRLAMAALFTMTALLCAGSLLNADVVGVLDSEHNRERYPNVDQDALTARLAELQIRYRVIHDAEVQDAAQLEGVAAVATAHTYCVSEAVGNALAEFVRKGGSVLWVDGPVFAESTAFCALFGITPGGKQACHYGRAFQTKCLQPEALLAQLDAPAKIEMFVGNAFMPESVDAGGVVYEATGEARLAGQSWEEKQERSVPAVISRKTGQGNALLLNWMALRNREPEVKAWVDRLILKFLPESVVNQDYRLSAAPGQRSYVVQPAPVTWSLDYEPLRELGEQTLQVKVTLLDEEGKTVAESEQRWEAGAASDHAVTVSTAGVVDGRYTLRVRSALRAGPWAELSRNVQFCGDAWAEEVRWRAEHRDQWARQQRVNRRLKGFVGNYAVMPHNADGSVDIPKLIRYCKDAHLDTFDWTLSRGWEDFLKFLPAADEAGIAVWATLSSPVTMDQVHGGGYAPHYKDYLAWGKELAQLSLKHQSLVAWVIDDFDSGWDTFTLHYVRQMVTAQRAINPELAFIPVLYTETISRMPDWMTTYGRYTDGIMWPYRPLDQSDDLKAELTDARAFVGPNRGLYINVYCTSTSWHKGAPTGEYVASVMRIARELTDGMRLYCLPWSQTNERYQAAVTLTREWATAP